MTGRHDSVLDRILIEADAVLRTVFSTSVAKRPYPADHIMQPELPSVSRKHSAGCMRVNHCGEVCAQALYRSQALLAQDASVVNTLAQCADEEIDHLAWCETRLAELGSRTSYLNVFWYSGSFFLGVLASIAGDAYNLGFVEETERQVGAHLAGHLAGLDTADKRSLAIISQMQVDEAQHADTAQALGGEITAFAYSYANAVDGQVHDDVVVYGLMCAFLPR